MTPTTPHAHGKLLFVAAILGILCTWAIFSYSIDNLDGLGLSQEIKKARTIEIIVFVFGEVFLSLAIGRVHKTHSAWAYKLAAVWFILLTIDFWGSYQARNAISLQQTLTRSATESHADLIKKQLEVNQTAAKELSDSSARQRANKMIIGSAQTAMQASKQADAGLALVDKHAAAIKDIRPTEADTFGEWNGTVIFMSIFGLYALNTLMWAFIGEFSNAAIPSPVTKPSLLKAVTFDLEKAKTTPSISYGKMLAGAGALAALTAAPITHAAPAPTTPVNVDTPAPTTPVNVDTPAPTTPVNVDTPAPVRRARVLNGVVMDTGIGEHDGYRFRRALECIKANTIRLSIDGLYAGVKASRPTAKRYIKAWADAGEIERNEDDTAWILAVKKGGAA